ncbi:MAG: DUF3810 domain-containing protein [Clostridia bacterium]|nr:DUF3810 domain-containing protein [Clostridia bacterium]
MDSYLKAYKGIRKNEKLPTASKIIFIITAFTAVLHIISAFSESFSDFFNTNISFVLRALLAFVTSFIPFSVAEILLMLLPLIAFLLIRHALKYHNDSWRSVFAYVGTIVSAICVFYILFFWCYGVGYNTETIDKKLGLDRADVSASELYETADILSKMADREAKNVKFRNTSFSVMPYNISELSGKLSDAYEKFSAQNNLLTNIKSNLKPVIMSEAMSYTHITGVYSFFTGEANINVNFPDYTIPFTAAHEMAHQRGIAREDEANFVAFLVCIGSDDTYIRYSGYVNMLEYVMSALYSADPDAYSNILEGANDNIIYEMIAYSNFFEKYRHSAASKISGTVNDTYLKLNGTEGEKSYGMVVDLAVAYYKAD